MDLSLHESLRIKGAILPSITEPTFGSKFEKFSNCRVLLIGDATNGTSEFYTARTKITRHLIHHHGFNIVAIQADWPDAEAIDCYVRRRLRPKPSTGAELETTGAELDTTGAELDTAFQQFPTWMWRNQETQEFVEWLRSHNKGLRKEKMTGFYGLDLFSTATSIQAILNYLDHYDAKMGIEARERYRSLQPWIDHPLEDGLGSLSDTFKSREANVLQMLQELLDKRLSFAKGHEDGEEFHNIKENARVNAGEHDFK